MNLENDRARIAPIVSHSALLAPQKPVNRTEHPDAYAVLVGATWSRTGTQDEREPGQDQAKTIASFTPPCGRQPTVRSSIGAAQWQPVGIRCSDSRSSRPSERNWQQPR